MYYKILKANSLGELEDKVNANLHAAFKLVGGVSAVQLPNTGRGTFVEYHQAVVFYPDHEEN